MSGLYLRRFREDVRLMHQLKSYELRHFLVLLDYAGGRRDPTFIPAKKREEVRLILGFGSGDTGREKFKVRLQRFHDLELIRLYDDGSFLISYLVDQEDDEDDDLSPPTNNTPHGPHAPGWRGPERRQSGRAYSNSDEARRKREYRQARAEAGDGPAIAANGDILRENVPSVESKRPAVDAEMSLEMSQMSHGEMSPEMSQNGRDIPGTSLAGVSPNVNVSGEDDNKIISDSGDVNNVVPEKMSHTNVPNVPRRNVPPPPSSSNAPPSARVPVRPGFEDVDANVQRAKDVEAVVRLAKDGKSRGFYVAAWKHCYAHDALDCWDMAVEITTEKIAAQAKHNYPPGHRDYLPPDAYGKSFNTTLGNLLRDNGTPYAQGTAAERAEVKSMIQASLPPEEAPAEEEDEQ